MTFGFFPFDLLKVLFSFFSLLLLFDGLIDTPPQSFDVATVEHRPHRDGVYFRDDPEMAGITFQRARAYAEQPACIRFRQAGIVRDVGFRPCHYQSEIKCEYLRQSHPATANHATAAPIAKILSLPATMNVAINAMPKFPDTNAIFVIRFITPIVVSVVHFHIPNSRCVPTVRHAMPCPRGFLPFRLRWRCHVRRHNE